MVIQYKMCKWCDHPFRKTRSDAKFCSDACKQKAYRRRADPAVGSVAREMQRQQKIKTTKRERQKRIVCETCGWEFERSIIETNRMYCSDACKQRAYRQRRKVK